MRPATASFSDAISEASAWSFSCWVVDSIMTNRSMCAVSAGATRTNSKAVGTDAIAQTTLAGRGNAVDRPPDRHHLHDVRQAAGNNKCAEGKENPQVGVDLQQVAQPPRHPEQGRENQEVGAGESARPSRRWSRSDRAVPDSSSGAAGSWRRTGSPPRRSIRPRPAALQPPRKTRSTSSQVPLASWTCGRHPSLCQRGKAKSVECWLPKELQVAPHACPS